MGLVSWVVLGMLAGLLAKKALPGPDPEGLVIALLMGTAGACAGGFAEWILGGTGMMDVDVWSALAAASGALVFLFLYRLIARRSE